MPTEYRTLHYWLLIPFVITVLGFTPSYWSRFPDAPLNWHLHSLSATLWYLILVMQPFLFNQGNIKRHRQLGMIGLLVAGFVAASALSVVRGHIKDLDPVYDVIYRYRYSLSLTDLMYVAGFIFALTMAILHSKRIDWHSRWMISTVFWVLSPATDRLVYSLFNQFGLAGKRWFDFEMQFWISHIFVIGILLLLIGIDSRRAKAPWLPYGLVIAAHVSAPIMLIYFQDSSALAAWFEKMYAAPF